jgi:hypothetical protein
MEKPIHIHADAPTSLRQTDTVESGQEDRQTDRQTDIDGPGRTETQTSTDLEQTGRPRGTRKDR